MAQLKQSYSYATNTTPTVVFKSLIHYCAQAKRTIRMLFFENVYFSVIVQFV